MSTNARQLTLRDPALASIMGLIANRGSNFGLERRSRSPRRSSFGDELAGESDPFGMDAGAEFGDEMGAEFGDEYGAEFGGRRRRPPSPAAVAAVWNKAAAMQAQTHRRAAMLEPNKGSTIKIEKYAFPLSNSITLGTAVAFTTLTGQPDTSIRPQRVTCNAPSPMFAFFQEIKVANVSVTIGAGLEDAWDYNALGVGQSLDMPTLSPANRATVLGSYSGFVPPGFVGGTATTFTVTFKGPATLAA
jgi:hypothetical protein